MPVFAAVLGALVIATSATLVALSGAEPATVTVFRCAYAVPLLAALGWWERRRHGALPRKTTLYAWIAGAFLAGDLVLWHHSIGYVGAGLATVLANLQVIFVAVAAWWLLGERPSRNVVIAIPVVFSGVVLLSGLFDTAAYGENPLLGVLFGIGTSISYAAFLLVIRHGSTDRRRVAGPLAHASAAAALTALVLGPVDLVPEWPAHGWLLVLAIGPQAVGYLLITYSLPRQPAAFTSLLLFAQPVGAIVLSAAVLDERPSPLQLAGCVVIAAGVLYGSRSRSAKSTEPDPPEPGDESAAGPGPEPGTAAGPAAR
ncbi:DMT family transporter [Rhizohabitans arisaemae]|uniref:DMT family transporter n=1 Tax=Rhizohabitans arisaemae TaxID=2720610 RepID=UPI0024B14A1D|nr:DMT family transporter [Rhizohabitans arisaemae]